MTYKNKLSQESNVSGLNNSAAGVTNCNFNPIFLKNYLSSRSLDSMTTDEEYISRAKQLLEEKDNELRRLRER